MDSSNWAILIPEIFLLFSACAIALIDLGVKSRGRTLSYALTLVTLVILAVIHARLALSPGESQGVYNMVVSDPLGNWLKCFAAIAVAMTLVYARPYAIDRDMLRGGEMFSLSLLALLGMFVMITGNNFLVMYLGLELLTLTSYTLVALRRDHLMATEAAMKYFVLGALASGFLLYGLSMLYGATGSLDINEVFAATASGQVKHQVLVLGLVFVVSGLAFKLGTVPFHSWVPDVYQGAPTAITLMIAAAPKLAVFALAMRLLVSGLLPLSSDWQGMLLLMAVASLLVGNLTAIAQTNFKRMLAYSTIAQMGFVQIGLLSGVVGGDTAPAANAYSSAMFYMVTYVLSTLAAFGVILLLARDGFESEEIADLAGLNQRSPLYAAVLAVCLISLAGVPPMVGFYAKFAVLQALIASGLSGALALAIFAVLMSLIGAYYYIRIIKVMYFDNPITATTVTAGKDVRVVLGCNGALIVILGIVPGGLMNLCSDAILQFLGS